MDYLFYIVILLIFIYIFHFKKDIYGQDKQIIRKQQRPQHNDNIVDIFKNTANKYPNHSALRIKKGNRWIDISYNNYYKQCCMFLNSLKSMNIGKRSRVCIMGHNSPEWFYAHMGSMMGKTIPIGIYPTAQEKTCEYIIDHSKPRVLVIENLSYLDKFKNVLNDEEEEEENKKKKENNNNITMMNEEQMRVTDDIAYDNNEYLDKFSYGYNDEAGYYSLENFDQMDHPGVNPVNLGEYGSFSRNKTRHPTQVVVEEPEKPKKDISVRCIVVYGVDKLDTHEYNKTIKIYTWKEFLDIGKNSVYQQSYNIEKDDVATIIYTSGTTDSTGLSGASKGVVLTHNNISSTIYALFDRLRFDYNGINIVMLETAMEHSISYLPLNHIAAQMMDIYLPICIASTVSFADKEALKGSLINTLTEVRPTIFVGVPRVWEKMYEKIESELDKMYGSMSSMKRILLDLASTLTTIPNDKIIERLGLDRCKLRLTMSAPLSQNIKDFYFDLGLPVYEVYGMSESCGPVTMSLPTDHRYKSVGRPLNAIQVKTASNGEILLNGPTVFKKYYKDKKNTEAAKGQSGWYHTGDIGYVDKDGYLYITGRLKELIITAGGENIYPVEIENNIKQCLPIISYAVVVGDRRKFLSVLLVLKMKSSKDGEPTILLADETKEILKSISSKTENILDAEDDPKLKSYIDNGIQCANKLAASKAHYIQKWRIIPTSFSIKGGELTPTLKLKRGAIADKYKELIDKIYSLV